MTKKEYNETMEKIKHCEWVLDTYCKGDKDYLDRKANIVQWRGETIAKYLNGNG